MNRISREEPDWGSADNNAERSKDTALLKNIADAIDKTLSVHLEKQFPEDRGGLRRGSCVAAKALIIVGFCYLGTALGLDRKLCAAKCDETLHWFAEEYSKKFNR